MNGIGSKGGLTRLPYRLPPCGDLLDPRHRLHQIVERIGVTETNVVLAVLAESIPAQACHPRLVQQKVGEFLRAHASPGDIGEGVEGPAGERAAESGNGIEALADGVAPSAELRHHAPYS